MPGLQRPHGRRHESESLHALIRPASIALRVVPVLAVVMLMAAGCDRSTSSSDQRPTVTLYCSVDDPSEILAAFTRETGI